MHEVTVARGTRSDLGERGRAVRASRRKAVAVAWRCSGHMTGTSPLAGEEQVPSSVLHGARRHRRCPRPGCVHGGQESVTWLRSSLGHFQQISPALRRRHMVAQPMHQIVEHPLPLRLVVDLVIQAFVLLAKRGVHGGS